MTRNKSANKAVAELKHLYISRSLNQLINKLRQYWQGRLTDSADDNSDSR